MGLIPDEKIQEIAQANDIVDVLSTYIRVIKKGNSHLGLCPFHSDKNPSMNISKDKQMYHCFSCGASGNIFRFIQHYEKVTFPEAAKILADRAGVEMKGANPSNPLYEVNNKVTQIFQNNINTAPQAERDVLLSYMQKRGLVNGTVEHFKLGYALRSWDALTNKIDKKAAEELGLIVKKENRHYDRFRGRLMFPIFDELGKIIGFGGRNITEDKTAKYMNSPESSLYKKRKVLYGLNFAKHDIKDEILLVEGYMDVISLHKAGMKNVVSISGTALTEDQCRTMLKYADRVVLLLDADEAGEKAMLKSLEVLFKVGLDVDVVPLPPGEDPDSLAKDKGKKGFKGCKRVSIIQYLSRKYNLEKAGEKSKFVKEAISLANLTPDHIKREIYRKEISKLTEISPKAIKLADKPKEQPKPSYKMNLLDEELLRLFVRGNKTVIEYLGENLYLEEIKDPIAYEISVKALDQIMDEGSVDVTNLSIKLPEKIQKELSRVAVTTNKTFNMPEARNILKSLKIRRLEEEKASIRKDGNMGRLMEINAEISRLRHTRH